MATLTGRVVARLYAGCRLHSYISSAAVLPKTSIVDHWKGSSDVQYTQYRNAGHSKWANIKHTKGAKDMERSKEITKYLAMVKLAVKEGGGATDPSKNLKLAQTIGQIKDAKLPMGAFDKLLQNLQNKKEEKTVTLPIKGPGRTIFIVELSSDNINRARQDLNTVLRKNKGVLMEESAFYQFNHKGVIYCSEIKGTLVSSELLEQAVEDAINAGADDVIFIPDHSDHGSVFEFSTSPSALFKVKQTLESMKYSVAYADVDYIPITPLELEDSDIQDAHKLYQKLADLPEVQRVSTNIA